MGARLGLVALFHALVGGLSLLTRARGRPLPERIEWEDVALLGLATHKLSRLLTKSKVIQPLRAPFSEPEGPGAPGELDERPRGSGWRRAVGELLTCPYCTGVWLATGLHFGAVLAPRPTRFAAGVLSSVALSDFLHAAYVTLTERAVGDDSRAPAAELLRGGQRPIAGGDGHGRFGDDFEGVEQRRPVDRVGADGERELGAA